MRVCVCVCVWREVICITISISVLILLSLLCKIGCQSFVKSTYTFMSGEDEINDDGNQVVYL